MHRTKFLNIGAAMAAVIGLAALFVGSSGDAWAAPNLLTNGDFDANASAWTAGADTTITWDNTQDYYSDLGNSGAARVTFTGTAPGSATAGSDCVDLGDVAGDGDGTYEFEGKIKRNPQAWDPASRAVIFVTRYDDDACTTNPVASTGDQIDLSNDGWFPHSNNGLPSSVVVSGQLSMRITLEVQGATADDEAYFDEIWLSDGQRDPTPTYTFTATAQATNTPTPTNTVAPTNTPTTTNTPDATPTDVPTDTPVPSSTPTTVPPTNTPLPTTTTAPAEEDAGSPPEAELESGAGGGGEQPEDGVGAGGEQPEDQEFPESGTGPGSYSSGEGSRLADVIATFSFALALAMLGTGFYMRRRYQEQESK